ncbi:MAG: DUF4188 domain-containing protein [Nocardioidaceae bacterium]
MTADIQPGRVTAAYDGDVVVFLIGMRINKPWRLRSWWPVVTAMPLMLQELAADPDSGLLGYRMLIGRGGPTLIQYWESMDKLQGFAGDPGRTHRPAWLAYFQRSYRDGGAGIWHETYLVPAGNHESVYGNMPKTGLGAVGGVVAVSGRGETAAERLRQTRTSAS